MLFQGIGKERKKSLQGFTLLELVVAMVIFAIVIVVVISAFLSLYKGKVGLDARQTLTRDSYFLLERLQTMIKDYTIDYEEYWNRQHVGCSTPGDGGVRNTGGNCEMFTAYGNQNNHRGDTTLNNRHRLFYCSSSSPSVDLSTDDYKVYPLNGAANYISRCLESSIPSNGDFFQSYGQYKALFIDVKSDVDFILGAVGDDDDDDLGNIALPAVVQSPQELYLLSRDGKERLFLRRKTSGSGHRLQVLQLRGFDAGVNHDFVTSPGVYDGKIDTRACDASLGFSCQGESVGSGIYSGYKLPYDADDGREDLTNDSITISDWSLDVQPLSNPYLSRANATTQINPYIKISFTTKLSEENWLGRLSKKQIEQYDISLQTMFSLLPAQY